MSNAVAPFSIVGKHGFMAWFFATVRLQEMIEWEYAKACYRLDIPNMVGWASR